MTAMALDVRELNLQEIDWVSGGEETIGAGPKRIKWGDGSITISCCDIGFITSVH